MMKLPEQFDEAILGIGSRCGFEDVFVYDAQNVVQIFMKFEGMSEEEAWDHFYYNVQGSYIGETTPVFVHPDTEAEQTLEKEEAITWDSPEHLIWELWSKVLRMPPMRYIHRGPKK